MGWAIFLMQKLTINVVTRLQDNGDGGYTMYAYNSNDELIKDHPDYDDGEITDERRAAILDGESEYEDGYIDSDTIEIEIDEATGLAYLAEPLSFHAGQ
tara:strand:+ start:398 stop:694 length:297 start_codon:yes stop_codon:yes gene_type:complete